MGRVVAPAKIVAEEAIVCVWGGGRGVDSTASESVCLGEMMRNVDWGEVGGSMHCSSMGYPSSL